MQKNNSIEAYNEIRKISVARWYEPFVATLIVIFTYLFLHNSSLSVVQLDLSIIFFVTVYYFISEIFKSEWFYSYKQTVENRDLKSVWQNTFTKFLGIIFGIALILFMYWLIPEYQNVRYLGSLREAKYIFLPIFLPVSFLLVFVTEYILGPKADGTFQMGLFLQLKLEQINWRKFKDGMFEWLLRLVFLTLNFTTSVSLLNTLRNNPYPFLDHGFAGAAIGLESTIFLILIFTILPGYVFSSRLIGTEVKKIDTTWFAWVITLICYQPFIQPIFMDIFNYNPDVSLWNGSPAWVGITLNLPVLMWFLGIGIVLSALMHLWGEAILGIRSSNISNRGIVTNGPFKYTKHPVYVAKCLGWFFATLPFFNGANFLESIKLGILFLIVCAIFAGRALAEEKLLANDANYIEYAKYVDNYGLFSFVGKYLFFMNFNWRLNFWKNNGYLKFYE